MGCTGRVILGTGWQIPLTLLFDLCLAEVVAVMTATLYNTRRRSRA